MIRTAVRIRTGVLTGVDVGASPVSALASTLRVRLALAVRPAQLGCRMCLCALLLLSAACERVQSLGSESCEDTQGCAEVVGVGATGGPRGGASFFPDGVSADSFEWLRSAMVGTWHGNVTSREEAGPIFEIDFLVSGNRPV